MATPLSSWAAWSLRNNSLTHVKAHAYIGNFHSASDTSRHRLCSIENKRLDPTSSFLAVTKLRNRMKHWRGNSSELSCISLAAGGQSVVPWFSESLQLCCEEERDVLICISHSDSARASHTVIPELYTNYTDMLPASRATIVKDIISTVESFCNRFRRFLDR